MIRSDKPRRPRGASPRGDFEEAKQYANRTEQLRLENAKLKTAALREARLKKQFEGSGNPNQ